MKTISLFLIFCAIITNPALAQEKEPVVLFVCEHGSAKSVVAATHFEKLAAKEGLSFRVVSRGTNPDPEIPGKVIQFLVDDGFTKPTMKPQKLSDNDLKDAAYVISFSPLPSHYIKPGKIETWDIPSFEAGYSIARDSIVSNLQRLIIKLKTDRK